jgi:hypothetical protein
MARYIVKLAEDDAFAADCRTFWGLETLKITTTPSEPVELTEDQARSMRQHGVIVEPVNQVQDADPEKAFRRKEKE